MLDDVKLRLVKANARAVRVGGGSKGLLTGGDPKTADDRSQDVRQRDEDRWQRVHAVD